MFSIGTWHYPWGKIIAIGMLRGERYYWFENKRGVIAMIPAFAFEKIKELQARG